MNDEQEKLMYAKLKGELSEEQILSFDQKLNSDKEFRADFEIYQLAYLNLGDKNAMILRGKLNEIYSKTQEVKKGGKMIKMIKQNRFSAVAAMAAIVLLIGAYWFLGNTKESLNEKLYNTYYNQDEVYVNTRSKVNLDIDVLQTGMSLLEKKDFNGALLEFNKLPGSVTANYYAGVANMELKQHAVAVSKFDFVITNYLNLFYDQAKWYKGLCLVKLDRENEAISLFGEIANSESYFKEKAKEIVVDLKKK
ncbi:MAG TPA: hypothetical protein DCG69_10755 [Bacteroidales bacterium]|nr:hypothetical protein [Bacteroidales bacterium]